MKNWRAIRPDGVEVPYWPLGPFKMRLPGVHYRWEWADYIQGLVMCAVCLSIIPVLQDTLGMPFEVALAIVVLNGILYCLHALLGDPVVPGWVTPAIPLLIAYVSSYPAGPERMHALIAFELLLGLWCIFLGITGLANRVIASIPPAIKSGVIIGAGISAIYMIFQKGGRFEKFPITITIAIGLAFWMMYAESFKKLAERNKIARVISNLGILPSILLAVFIAALVKESGFPAIEWGISRPDFATLWTDWVPWGKLGWPSIDYYIKALPLVLAAYIVIFGDAVQCQAIIRDAQKFRSDDPVDYNPNRAHLIVGIRNTGMSILGPDISMCGPIWAAMTVVTYERWKNGRAAMDSSIGGVGAFRFGTLTGYFILPIVSLVRPILPVALSLTMLIQGFVSLYVGVKESRNIKDLGIAGIVGGMLLAKGAAYAFGAGIIMCLLVYGRNFFKGDSTPNLFAEEKVLQPAEKATGC
ncbi:solute carrier family 23 protein [Desulfofundulus thermosubterraneus]|uniref:Permease family protein n=1 Tax=Desulfofundulus thermosubterraneus DSM 16057 TaxID=1121432 RepID=A0A1M6G6V1_9FIRM|nr:solute carrier family 23 protein [Desulfofundulus thermosubterraneus]SHJ05698.1 Permease family protein [Desulfofundulus thermosubterraneus DSM 16057]